MNKFNILIVFFILSFFFCCHAAESVDFNSTLKLDESGQYKPTKQALEKLISNKNDKHFSLACFMLANYYYESRRGIAKDKGKAVKLYNESLKKSLANAERGKPESQYIVAICTRRANFNSKLAFDWLKKSAEQNYAPAQAKLAFWYMKGIGTTQDFDKAAEWAKKASDQGSELGMALLGAYYLNIKKDTKKGIELIKRSADSGNAGGQYMLYRLMYYGKGIKKDRKKARELLQKAADQGLDDAVTKLRIINSRKAKIKNRAKQ